MHETALVVNLIRQIQSIAGEKGIHKIKQVNLKVGILFPVSVDHLREHFHWAAGDTPLKGVTFNIRLIDQWDHPDAQNLIVESIEEG